MSLKWGDHGTVTLSVSMNAITFRKKYELFFQTVWQKDILFVSCLPRDPEDPKL